MATIRQTVMPLADYPSGQFEIPARALPDSVRSVYFELQRCTAAQPAVWDKVATTVKVSFEGSTDGVSWTASGGFGANGGIHIRANGSEATVSGVIIPLPPFTNRQIRASVLITAGPLRTLGLIELRD